MIDDCRMYEHVYPLQDELVLVTFKKQSEDIGIYVSLLEFNNIEGLIPCSEMLKRGKILLISKKNPEVVRVLRVDEAKGYIDLSKRKVTALEVEECQMRYRKSKQVHRILGQVAETCRVPLSSLYTGFVWDLHKRFGHALDAFRLLLREEEAIQILAPYELTKDVQTELIETLQQQLAPKPQEVKAEIAVTCFSPDGIEAIQAALRAGAAHEVQINLVSTPVFALSYTTTDGDLQKGMDQMKVALHTIEREIVNRGGSLTILHPSEDSV